MWPRLAAATLAAAVVVFGLHFRTGVASGADSYGYVSEAALWRAGDLHVAQPWVNQLPWPDRADSASPLGYRPAGNPPEGVEPDAIVPVYSPGLPVLMAAAQAVAGQQAAFWIVPFFAGLFVVCTYAIGARVSSPMVALGAAFLAATSPVVLFMATFPMTDVVVAAVWAAATWAALGRSRARALAAGLVSSYALFVRPNLVFVGALVGVWMIARDLRRGRPFRIDRAAIFAIGTAPGLAAVLLFNRALYGSPFVSGYGSLDSVLHAGNLWTNLRDYAGWIAESQTPVVLLGLIPLALPLTRFWRDRERAFDARLLAAIAAGTLACYLFFQPPAEWWYARFMLTLWPGMFIGLGVLGAAVLPARYRWVTALVVLALGAFAIHYIASKRPDRVREGERRFISAARYVRDHTEPNSVIFSFVHSGSVRYYGERMTLRYDVMPPEWLDRSIDWLSAHGAHPYLLVEQWELEKWQALFAGASVRGRMAIAPVAEFTWPTHMWLYDLTRASASSWPVIDGFHEPRLPPDLPPGAPPQLILK